MAHAEYGHHRGSEIATDSVNHQRFGATRISTSAWEDQKSSARDAPLEAPGHDSLPVVLPKIDGRAQPIGLKSFHAILVRV